METIVNYSGGAEFEVQARGHRVVCDQPAENGGGDAGMTPPEFLLASLGACAAFYAAQYLRARSLPTEGLQVRVSAGKAAGPARLAAFRIEIRVPGLAEEKHQAGVLRAAKSCLIHNTLLQPPAIETTLNTDLAARA
ncbi:MAG: OsmC family protein [Bryobacteraceae bacterium]